MATIQLIPIAQLLIDSDNPRIEDIGVSQRDAIRTLVGSLQRKIISLAKDIVEHGLNPSEALIVMPHSKSPVRYIVLEGNRRICALKV